MGNYAVLTIGDLQLSFKNYIPVFLGFLFTGDDFYSVRSDESDDDWWWEELGYSTTVARAVGTLESQGYSMDLFARVLEVFREDIVDVHRYLLGEAITAQGEFALGDEEVENRIDQHLASIDRGQTNRQKLDEFVHFLRDVLESGGKTEKLKEPYVLRIDEERAVEIPAAEFLLASGTESRAIDFESLQTYLSQHVQRLPLAVCQVGLFFDETFFVDYPEIVWLAFLRVALQAADENDQVRLELSDIVEEEEEARLLQDSLSSELVRKVNVYNQVFQVLFEKEAHFRELNRKAQARELLARARTALDRNAKGRLLEQLAQLLFVDDGQLLLSDKQVRTGDEEIDLVLRNNVDRPFWLALQSPLVFVECKNWSDPVPASEIRGFWAKLVNHGNLTRVGFFVSLNGFTGAVDDQLKRLSQDEKHIVLVTGDDIDSYLAGGCAVLDWLEALLSQLA